VVANWPSEIAYPIGPEAAVGILLEALVHREQHLASAVALIVCYFSLKVAKLSVTVGGLDYA
jgi:hypothetical protein